MHINFGDLPTWISSVAAIGALVAAIIAYRSLSAQVKLLRIQVSDQQEFNKIQKDELEASREERNRQAFERRSEQASRVYMECHFDHPYTDSTDKNRYLGEVSASASVVNQSDRPIYDVRLAWYMRDGTALTSHNVRDSTERIMPKDRPFSVETSWRSHTDPSMFGVKLYFRDAAGVTWRAGRKGELVDMGSNLENLKRLEPGQNIT